MTIILMGVTGCGKTTVGRLLADTFGWPFYDADDFHPSENVEKMSKGIPLDDSDRRPWLEALAELIQNAEAKGEHLILACSALKSNYRKILSPASCNVKFVYLSGTFDTIQNRLVQRKGHYMDPNLLASQFATLEPPKTGEALMVDISPSPDSIAKTISEKLQLVSMAALTN